MEIRQSLSSEEERGETDLVTDTRDCTTRRLISKQIGEEKKRTN